MKFFKNHTVAVVVTILVIAGCCVYGFLTRPNETAADLDPLEYGRENYQAYLGWIDDQADILSDDTEREVAVAIAAMDQEYGSIITLVTETDAGGMSLPDRAVSIANDAELSGRDMILLIDTGADNWYLQPGQDISGYLDSDFQAIVTASFGAGSVTAEADAILPELYRDLFTWYQDNLTPQDASGSGLMVTGLVMLIVVLIIVFASTGVGRVGTGYGFWGPYWGPIFFPMRFPGGPIRPRRRPPYPYDPPHRGGSHRGPFDGGFGGFGGGGFGGGGRGGGFGGGGGGFGGGGFGGGGRGGGFGG